jgi:PIN domain nuclease of toxin-antitoxin system
VTYNAQIPRSIKGVPLLPPLPPYRDPFDRLLVARARTKGLFLLAADEALASFRGPIRPE